MCLGDDAFCDEDPSCDGWPKFWLAFLIIFGAYNVIKIVHMMLIQRKESERLVQLLTIGVIAMSIWGTILWSDKRECLDGDVYVMTLATLIWLWFCWSLGAIALFVAIGFYVFMGRRLFGSD